MALSNFFQKSILYEGGIFDIWGGSQIHPPGLISKIWPDFRNLTLCTFGGGYIVHFCISRVKLRVIHHTPYTIHPRTGSHTAHSSMTTTKRVTRIVHIVTLVCKTRNEKTANRELDELRTTSIGLLGVWPCHCDILEKRVRRQAASVKNRCYICGR
jgi:hypothetical protein